MTILVYIRKRKSQYNSKAKTIYFLDCNNDTFTLIWDNYKIISNKRIIIWNFF